MKLTEEPVTVTSLLNGELAAALLHRCSECEGIAFLVLAIMPGKRLHLQCEQCGATYCFHEGPCAAVPPLTYPPAGG